MEAMGKFVQKSMKDGTLVDTGGLLPSKEGARIRLANGKLTVTDGPFTESKEVIGGWAILKADSKAEAIRIATEFMELHRSTGPASRASPRCARCSTRAWGPRAIPRIVVPPRGATMRVMVFVPGDKNSEAG
jgi:hypothetical protein